LRPTARPPSAADRNSGRQRIEDLPGDVDKSQSTTAAHFTWDFALLVGLGLKARTLLSGDRASISGYLAHHSPEARWAGHLGTSGGLGIVHSALWPVPIARESHVDGLPGRSMGCPASPSPVGSSPQAPTSCAGLGGHYLSLGNSGAVTGSYHGSGPSSSWGPSLLPPFGRKLSPALRLKGELPSMRSLGRGVSRLMISLACQCLIHERR